MQLGHSASPVQYVIRTVGCLVIVAQWQSTMAPPARCPGLISGDCQLFHFVLKSLYVWCYLQDDFHDTLSSTGLTPTVSSRWLTLASLKVLTPKVTLGRRRVKLSSYRWNGFLQKLWLKESSQRNLMWWVLWYRVPLSITLSPTPWTVYPPPSSSSPPPSASPSPALGRSFDQFCHATQS